MKLILCQNCQQRPMQLAYTYIYNGQRKDYFLCRECAKILHIEKSVQISTHKEETLSQEQNFKDTLYEKTQLDSLDSKILALTLDQEKAVAEEHYLEAARIQKILHELLVQRDQKRENLHLR